MVDSGGKWHNWQAGGSFKQTMVGNSLWNGVFDSSYCVLRELDSCGRKSSC